MAAGQGKKRRTGFQYLDSSPKRPPLPPVEGKAETAGPHYSVKAAIFSKLGPGKYSELLRKLGEVSGS